jgi:hypothetical protein
LTDIIAFCPCIFSEGFFERYEYPIFYARTQKGVAYMSIKNSLQKRPYDGLRRGRQTVPAGSGVSGEIGAAEGDECLAEDGGENRQIFGAEPDEGDTEPERKAPERERQAQDRIRGRLSS